MLVEWLLAFAATIGIESPVVVAATRGLGIPIARRLWVAVLAQALTHPLVWFVFPHFPGDEESWFWLSELVAVLVEGLLYARAFGNIGGLRAIGIAALANGLSLGAGVAWSSL